MEFFAKAVLLSYAVVLVLGGFAGWKLGGARMSFTAGLGSAALLAVAYRISTTSPFGGYLLAAIIAAALAILFSRRFNKTKQIVPAGLLSLFSLSAAILLAGAAALAW